jgi:hypothetical protein
MVDKILVPVHITRRRRTSNEEVMVKLTELARDQASLSAATGILLFTLNY